MKQKHRSEYAKRWHHRRDRKTLVQWLRAPRMSRKLGYQLSKCSRVIRVAIIHQGGVKTVLIWRHKMRLQPLPWRIFFARLIRSLRAELSNSNSVHSVNSVE